MNEENDRIEVLVREFQSISPTSEQSLKWHLAVQEKRNKRRNFYQVSLGLAAGLAIGVAISGFILEMSSREPKEDFSATLAMVSVKNLMGN